MNDFYVNFARACQDHTFAARIQMGTPRNNQNNENGKCLMGKKNINDFDAKFASTSQDHTFAARIQVGTPRDSQRNETGKCLMGKKQKRLLCEFCARLSGSLFCSKGQSWDPKGQPKE